MKIEEYIESLVVSGKELTSEEYHLVSLYKQKPKTIPRSDKYIHASYGFYPKFAYQLEDFSE